MNQILIVYWSGTGNTAAMAEMVASGIRELEKSRLLFLRRKPQQNSCLPSRQQLLDARLWGMRRWRRA